MSCSQVVDLASHLDEEERVHALESSDEMQQACELAEAQQQQEQPVAHTHVFNRTNTQLQVSAAQVLIR